MKDAICFYVCINYFILFYLNLFIEVKAMWLRNRIMIIYIKDAKLKIISLFVLYIYL